MARKRDRDEDKDEDESPLLRSPPLKRQKRGHTSTIEQFFQLLVEVCMGMDLKEYQRNLLDATSCEIDQGDFQWPTEVVIGDPISLVQRNPNFIAALGDRVLVVTGGSHQLGSTQS
jgi:hypothetical protein